MRFVRIGVVLVVVTAAAGLALPASAGASAGRGAPGLPYDPTRAPVVFIPGLVASELTCGPDGPPPLNLWTGTFATFFPPKFGHLALINTDDGGGGVTSRTTSTDEYPLGCGSVPYGPGTAARHQPVVRGPTWCLPENEPVNPDPVPCSPAASVEYSAFGLAMQEQIARDGRGQIFVSYPWDWRMSPVDQVGGLQSLLEEVTARAGSKATVVAHSFGNIVFREWTRFAEEGAGADALVGRFLSVAGPWSGVSTAWTHPAFGQIQPGIDGAQLSRYERLPETAQVFQTAPGTYWLFPNASLTQQITAEFGGEGWLAVPDGAGSRWVPQSEVGDAAVDQFQLCPQSNVFPCQVQRLYDLGQAGTPPPGFRTGGVEWIGIVGAGVGTAGQICSGCTTFPDGGTGVPNAEQAQGPQTVWSIRNVNGDQNVPVSSGIQGTDPFNPPGDAVPFYFTCGVTHMGLMRDDPVLAQTVPFLLGDGDLTYDGVFTREPCGLPGPPVPVAAAPTFTG